MQWNTETWRYPPVLELWQIDSVTIWRRRSRASKVSSMTLMTSWTALRRTCLPSVHKHETPLSNRNGLLESPPPNSYPPGLPPFSRTDHWQMPWTWTLGIEMEITLLPGGDLQEQGHERVFPPDMSTGYLRVGGPPPWLLAILGTPPSSTSGLPLLKWKGMRSTCKEHSRMCI